MTQKERISALSKLGEWFANQNADSFASLCQAAANTNNWFTVQSIRKSFDAWAFALTPEKLEQWVSNHKPAASPKKVGLVLAGNIPMVGLHDVLSVLISGHIACLKFSSQDAVLMKAVLKALTAIDDRFHYFIVEVEQLKDIDVVIATGSDNSARYFKHYFGKYPHVIRQNRVSIGIINGNETKEDFEALGEDIFTYYSLGCRNVAKIYIPEGYELPKLIGSMDKFSSALDHHKYRNNYDYNKSIYLVNREPHLDSGFFLMREAKEMVSPISVVFYETFKNEAELALNLSSEQDKIQCIVSKDAWYEGSLPFGTAQSPELWDYADGVDTLEFLEDLT